MKRRTDYKICPYCGAALDVGEICDCRPENEAPKRPQDARNRAKAYKYPLRRKNAVQGRIRA